MYFKELYSENRDFQNDPTFIMSKFSARVIGDNVSLHMQVRI